jgi:cytochrome c biogenesis factor
MPFVNLVWIEAALAAAGGATSAIRRRLVSTSLICGTLRR